MRAPSTKVVKLYIIAIIFGIITHGNINRVDTVVVAGICLLF